MSNRDKMIQFLEGLNKLTNETGVRIENFGEHFYDPKLVTADTNSKDDQVFLSWDKDEKRYIGTMENPYGEKELGYLKN